MDYNKSYFIGRKEVLSETALGASVVNSSLTSVGTLAALAVSGDVDIAGTATIANLNATSVKFGNVTINENGFDTAEGASITADGHRVLYSDHSQISIGDVLRRDKPVKVFGALSVGINNPDPSVNFSVPGDVSIGNKKFTNGMAAPTTGSFQIGDICWNTKPQANSYVGWVCVAAGDPGEWLPFGSINLQ